MTSPLTDEPFRLGAAEGVVPTKWVRKWGERLPRVPLELIPLGATGGEAEILEGVVDAGIVRLPIASRAAELHVISLYEEIPVIVVPKDHYVCAAEEAQLEDFAEEIVLDPVDGVRWPSTLGVPSRERPPDTSSAIRLVAAGVGVLVVPKSLARLHHRKDLTYRPVIDLPTVGVGLCWRVDSGDARIEELVGIVRGRSPHSTRGVSVESRPKRNAAEKAAARREYLAQTRGDPGSGTSRRNGRGGAARRRGGRPGGRGR